uniref:Toxin n=1 Tax=Macrostomum lignano TaxID=282301 RepID=A0A1I8H5G0_9PLAT
MKYFIMLLAIVMVFGFGSRACRHYCIYNGRMCDTDYSCCSEKCKRSTPSSRKGKCVP